MFREFDHNKIKGIKLVYKEQTKRINEKVENYESLLQKIKTVFNLIQNANSVNLNVFYISEDGVKHEIKDNNNFLKFFNYNKSNCVKFLVESVNTKINYNTDFTAIEIPENENKKLSSPEEIDSFSVKNVLKGISDELEEKSYKNICTTPTKCTNISSINPIKEKLEDKYSANILNLEKEIQSVSINETNKQNMNTNIFESSSLIIDRQFDSNIELKQENFIRDFQNNIKLSGSIMDFVDISEESQPPDAIFRDICSMCSRNIYFIKYSCCICNNMVTCEYCEEIHSHPMIKFKNKQLSTKEDLINLMISRNKKQNSDVVGKNFLHKIKEISNIFDKKITIKIVAYSHYITVRPNRKFKLPLIIINESCQIIPKNKLMVLARNIKDLNIAMHAVEFELNMKEKCQIFLECESTEQIKIYDIELFAYHSDTEIESKPIEIKIEVNLDKEEDHLNEYFMMYPVIIALTKKEKELLYYIIKNGICGKHPIVIYNIMMKYEWNLNEAIQELKMDYDVQKIFDFEF